MSTRTRLGRAERLNSSMTNAAALAPMVAALHALQAIQAIRPGTARQRP
jgi:hypothetical protein